MVIYWRKNRLGKTRLGLTVSKKLGNSPQRNRIRRILREGVRKNLGILPAGHDIVIVARSRCIDASFDKLTRAYLSLAEKAGILRDSL